MQYRTLGNTDLRVGEISLGCAGFEGREHDAVCHDLAYAMDRGVNFLDLFASDPALRSNISMKDYEAGHMFYLDTDCLAAFRADVGAFIAGAV